MKYQALKRLKTKTKLLKLCDTLAEADQIIKQDGGIFNSFAYIGGWPVYVNEANNLYYNIQGLADVGVVCSIPQQELDQFDFTAGQEPEEVKCICACGNEHMTQPL